MLLDLWPDEYDEISGMVTDERVDSFKKQIDRTPFEELEERLHKYGVPVRENFPDGESMITFVIPNEGEHKVKLRASSEGSITNLYVTSELPDELADAEAIVRALDAVVNEHYRASHREVSYYRSKQEASMQYIIGTGNPS